MKKRAPQFEDCLRLERFTGGDYCEKNHLICYGSTRSNGVILKNLTDGTEKKITAGGTGEGNPKFSPDGDRVLFLSDVGQKGRQLFVYDCTTEKVCGLTHMRGAVSEPLWSPDGQWILFASTVGEKRAKREHEDDAIIIEELNYKFEGRGYIRPSGRMQLYVVPSSGGEAVQISEGNCDYLHHNWAPDSKSVVCVSDRFRRDRISLGYDLLMVENITDKPCLRQLSREINVVSYPNPLRPVFTPDGKQVLAGVLNLDESVSEESGYPEVYLWLFDVETGERTRIFKPDENCYQCVQFPYNGGCGWGMDKLQIDEDGEYAYFVSGWNGQCCLYRLRLKPEKGKEEGPWLGEKLLGGKAVYNGIGRIQQGKMLISCSKPDMPEAYYIYSTRDEEPSLQKVAQSAEDLLEELCFVCPEDFSVPTLDGESRIHGWVYGPTEREHGTYPAFLYVHGGPHPFYTYGFTMEHQCFAAAGFGVILCNPRGSSGYGRIHQNYERAVDGSAYYDCLQFVEEAVRRNSWIDGRRLGVTGGSYGGYMTNYMATHSKRFRVYITQRSVASELIMYGSSDMHGESLKYEKFENFMMDILKKSPVSYAERIDKPFLILQGEEDYRTPMEGAHQLFVAVKDLHPDLPVKLVIFPHTGHDQPSHPRLLMSYYKEMLDWFRKYL